MNAARRCLRSVGFGQLVVATLVLLLATALARAAHACSCATAPPAGSFAGAAAVFEGVARGPLEVVSERRLDLYGTTVRQMFEVKRRWKGEVEGLVAVLTSASSSSCGQTYQQDETYVVYAHAIGAHLWDALCWGSRPIAGADEDLAFLGAGQPPVAGSGAYAIPAVGRAPVDAGSDRVEGATTSGGGCAIVGGRSQPPVMVVTTMIALVTAWRRLREGSRGRRRRR